MLAGEWLQDAVLYQIFPASFADHGDHGVGSLRGVIEHLDHIASLGVDAIWLNPCFASPFVDAGYDVADYLTVAPRYGTNEDMDELVTQARDRGVRVLLDLVAGHTSSQHPWFRRELAATGPAPDGDRYVWRLDPPVTGWSQDTPGTPAWVPSPGPRPGWYLKNFYDEQPALNFGWTSLREDEPWRDPVDAPGPSRNRQALREIIDFWASRGVAGFRVDMAFSLVKDYDVAGGEAASTDIWREIRTWLDRAHPDVVLIPEGTEPRLPGAPLAFSADFALTIHEAHASLFDNHAAGVLPFHPPRDPFFDAEGRGNTRPFLDAWTGAREVEPHRSVVLSTADHDFNRLRCGPRTPDQLGAALTFLLTWGSVPCIYYGDEIGMRYLPGLPDVEGALCHPSYNRAGCRSPMQWDDGPTAGFSTAAPARLYLPIDLAADRPTVAAQQDDPGSTLNLVRALIALRRATPALQGHDSTRVLHEGYPLAYQRGQRHFVVVNPRREPAALDLGRCLDLGRDRGLRLLWGAGIQVADDRLHVDGFGYGVLIDEQ